ncbi:MAG: hypothetical protein OXC00_12105 [Acidimicrobiaceae bacterium]|nr:hypothetical protein [Acidimicrobiaceae bacterium]
MTSRTVDASRDVRYEPDERPPNLLSLGLGLQYATLAAPGIVLTPTMLIRAAGGSDAYLSWAVWAALVISGVTTAVQAVGVGRVGAGYVLLMGSSSAFLAICVSALEQGGPGLLATLIIISSVFQFAVAARLSVLRRGFTPMGAGAVLVVIPGVVFSLVLDNLSAVPAGASAAAAPVTAGVTLLAIVVIALCGGGLWRLWGPVIGMVAGGVTGGVFGIYDTAGILEADWIGLPPLAYPGLDLGFGPAFWALLPAFVLVTLVGAMDTLGDGIAVQRVSWRKPRAIDFRSIQGAMFADGVGNLLSGLAGTVPNSTYASGISIVELTGVAARTVGVCVGLLFAAMAFVPKLAAVLVAIPGPVVAAYFIIILALLFMFGLKILQNETLDYRNSLVVGLAFWLGIAFELDWVFPEYFQGALSELIGNGMTVGGLTVIALTLFRELTGPRRQRLRVALTVDAYPKIDAYLAELGARKRWHAELVERIRAVGEEALLLLTENQAEGVERRLLLIARAEGDAAVLEFIAATDATNLEDRMAVLGQPAAGGLTEQEVSLRLLQHYASSVRHYQYHDTDVVVVRVESAEA